jgi:hypothetical protein
MQSAVRQQTWKSRRVFTSLSKLTCLLRENQIKITTRKEEQVALTLAEPKSADKHRQEHTGMQTKLPASELTGSNPICSQERKQTPV